MPLKLSVPLEKEFRLERSDALFDVKDSSPTTVLIRQAKQGEHERRAALFAQIIRERSIDAPEDFVRFIQRFSFEELKRLEVYLTLKGSNIEDADGKPLWDFGKDGNIKESEFNKGWSRLPVFIAQEIHDCVLELNVDWQPIVGEAP